MVAHFHANKEVYFFQNCSHDFVHLMYTRTVRITELSCTESVHLIAFISAVVFGELLVFHVLWMRIIETAT
jgi:hypothetical protein